MRVVIFGIVCALLLGFRVPDLIPPPLDPPFTTPPKPRVEKEKIESLEQLEPRTANEEYELALFYILAGDSDLAKEHLQKALELKPHFAQAQLQMGYLLLWENQLEGATSFFQDVLESHPCDPQALYGLSQVAKQLGDQQAIETLEKLQACDPKNPDYLFYLAQRYDWTGQREKAQALYEKVLDLYPEYGDAAVSLARIYQSEKQGAQLKALAKKRPSDAAVQQIYAQYLSTYPDVGQAAQVYDRLPPNQRLWMRAPEAPIENRVSASLEATYTDAKESDPSLRQPVVKDYYFYTALNVFIPIGDKWRLDLKPFLYHQRENDIYPPVGVNYNIYESGAQLSSHYSFAPGWRWDVAARGFTSWGQGSEIYPFQNTDRFEPGSSIIYSTEHLFVLNAHVESFIIKNFSKQVSQLLRTDYAQATYGYRPNVFLHPKIETSASWVYYHDSFHNWKNKQTALVGIDLYFPELTTFYLFEYGRFNHLNPNYFSYKQQSRNTVEVKYHQEFSKGVYFETFWDHTWEVTHNLYLPIGDFVFVASRLYLIWNVITAQVGYQYKEKFKMELGGHYLHNSLPYTDWNLHGSLLWQF